MMILTSCALFSIFLLSACATVHKNGLYQTKRYTTGHNKHVLKAQKNRQTQQKTNKTQVPQNYAKDELQKASTYATAFVDTEITSTPLHSLFQMHDLPTDRVRMGEMPTMGYTPKEKITENQEKTQDDTCDVILLKNGEEILAKVLEIYPDEIRYKRCNNPTGPIRIERKTDVLFIKYSNGQKEIIHTTPDSRSQYTNQQQQEPTPNQNSAGGGAKALGILLIILGGFVALLTSLLIGLIAIALGIILLR